jgi:hypothetical protein
MQALTDAIIAILRSLPVRPGARIVTSLIPLGSIYWEDEMPDFQDERKLSLAERRAIYRLFAIRFKIWDDKTLSPDEQTFWDTARAEAPNWALFHRLALSVEEHHTRKQAEAYVAELGAYLKAEFEKEL